MPLENQDLYTTIQIEVAQNLEIYFDSGNYHIKKCGLQGFV